MDVEHLISLVKECEFLYDYNHKSYHDTQKKDAVWKAIGKKLNQSGGRCKRQWTALRDSYRRTLKKRKHQNTSMKQWKYEEEMSFVQPYLKEKPTTSQSSLLSSDGEESSSVLAGDTDEPQHHQQEPPIISNNVTNVTDDVIKYLLKDRKDEVETLFYSLAQTVKRMSPYHQALAKARVCAAVSELELQSLSRTDVKNNQTDLSNSEASSSHQELHSELEDVKPF